jgi:hypothetical protein
VVVRQLDGTPTLNRELDVWVLRQNAGGGLQTSWSLLTSELSARPVSQGGFPELGITSLRRMFAEDLEGSDGGLLEQNAQQFDGLYNSVECRETWPTQWHHHRH